MSWKMFVKDYLTFSRKDRIGIFCVLGLGLVIYLLPRLLAKPFNIVAVQQDTSLLQAIDTLRTNSSAYRNGNKTEEYSNSYQYEPSQASHFSQGELFLFDPNKLSTEGWKRLGLNDRIIRTINNYRSKGGKFYKPEDLKKIWGMPEGFYERVAAHIRIEPPNNNNFHQRNYSTGNNYQKKERQIEIVNVNEADTTAFIALPGIGSKLAQRITNFRDKLGGFYSVEQIRETYGLPDSTFQKIKPLLQIDDGAVKKININTATKDQLKVHPYIKWNLANAIVEYRNQHGKYSSLEDLKKIAVLDEVTFKKIAPYLSL
ncbi:MAG: helix-hairpin-helix domain-containing protein [Chitinophagaceae bacterium]